jgi:hypothetical protein
MWIYNVYVQAAAQAAPAAGGHNMQQQQQQTTQQQQEAAEAAVAGGDADGGDENSRGTTAGGSGARAKQAAPAGGPRSQPQASVIPRNPRLCVGLGTINATSATEPSADRVVGVTGLSFQAGAQLPPPPSSAANPFRSLGNALEEWKKRLNLAGDAHEATDAAAGGEDDDNADAEEFEFEKDAGGAEDGGGDGDGDGGKGACVVSMRT